MMKKAYIIGAGGHGRVIASIIQSKYQTINFVDQQPEDNTTILQSDFFDHLALYRNDDIFIGIGHNETRIRIYQALKNEGVIPVNCISANAFVAHDAIIGEGVVVCPGAVIGSRAIIGNNTIINTLSSVDHDCILGNHSQVTAGVTFGGGVKVGENCFFGIKSAVIPNITIGNNVQVMAGSVVYHHIGDNQMVGGTPARIVKNL
jgi:UDP-perosamine 4-acetyltransferase